MRRPSHATFSGRGRRPECAEASNPIRGWSAPTSSRPELAGNPDVQTHSQDACTGLPRPCGRRTASSAGTAARPPTNERSHRAETRVLRVHGVTLASFSIRRVHSFYVLAVDARSGAFWEYLHHPVWTLRVCHPRTIRRDRGIWLTPCPLARRPLLGQIAGGLCGGTPRFEGAIHVTCKHRQTGRRRD